MENSLAVLYRKVRVNTQTIVVLYELQGLILGNVVRAE